MQNIMIPFQSLFQEEKNIIFYWKTIILCEKKILYYKYFS